MSRFGEKGFSLGHAPHGLRKQVTVAKPRHRALQRRAVVVDRKCRIAEFAFHVMLQVTLERMIGPGV